MKITFYGGTNSVTGSSFLVETRGARILVDCGLFQGGAFAEEENYADFPFDPASIDTLVVTHAHLDHMGRTAKLIHDGFAGEIVGTPPTRALSVLSLEDSTSLLCREAERDKKNPLCLPADGERVGKQWRDLEYGRPYVKGTATITLHNAGHILGSAFAVITEGELRVAFSGDLGNTKNNRLIPQTDPLPAVHYVVLESTYGDKRHEDAAAREERLEDIVERSLAQKGVLLIPAFAIERTQELLSDLGALMEKKKIEPVPVYLDSTLAIEATEIYRQFSDYLRPELRGTRLFAFPNLRMTRTRDESLTIDRVSKPKIIIAGSGMSQGGRIVRHEKLYLSDPATILLVVGYQASGSLGRQLLDGAREAIIENQTVPVRASVESLLSYSAHADRDQLLEFLSPQGKAMKGVFLVHGEDHAKKALQQGIVDFLAVNAHIPTKGETVTLE